MRKRNLPLYAIGFWMGVIRIFPAWPSETDARFANLLAEGGFEVSAEQVNGRIGDVKIRATVAGTARLLSPWPSGFTVVEQASGAAVSVNVASGGIGSFPAVAGKTYLLKAVR
jgi:hypothetical protein